MKILSNKKIFILILILLIISSLSLIGWTAENNNYQNFNLSKIIKLTLKVNSQIKIARQKLKVTEANLAKSKANKLPKVNFESSYTEVGETESKVTNKDTYQAGLNGSYPLYTGNKLSKRINIRDNEVKKANLNLDNKKNEVIFKVTTDYYRLLKAKKLVNLTKKALTQVEAHLQVANSRYEAGAVLITDVLKTKVRKTKVQKDLINAKNKVEIIKSQLKNSIGLSQVKSISIKGGLKQTNYSLSLEECLEEAFINRADLKQFQLNLVNYQTKLEIAKASDSPELMLVGNYKWTGGEMLPEDNNWDLTLNLQLPLYDGGQTKAVIKEAEANLKQMKEIKWQLKEGIALEVKSSYLDKESAAKMVEVTFKSIQEAKENLRVERLRYKEGSATSTEVIDAEISLTTAKTNYLEAKYNYQMAVARLIKAMGSYDRRGQYEKKL
ncbi:TolC family protein [Selenihalanaerobacter shriftii]|uniref:Outer membrane protein TolC n=1 Tax=Selenihalanaerobacter shriftii TaxID=142842 RepID=A0A1T4LY66_9FIRM|nr:TolC family protein [Selenihalanaerobacter shriftii]SJZ59581.1 Outer membrane protein TolC [Selenihalanaerobacter shriftii]